MALENIVGASLRRRWIIAGLFGLVHGFGFADTLSEQLQFAGSNLLISLLSFNIGIEIGQLAVLCAFVPALALLFRGAMSGRMGIIVVSAIVAHTAWHWMLDRADIPPARCDSTSRRYGGSWRRRCCRRDRREW